MRVVMMEDPGSLFLVNGSLFARAFFKTAIFRPRTREGTGSMATIKKTFVTRLDNVVIFADGVRASVSLIDSEDDKNVTAHLMVVVKDGKVVQPPVALDVDPAVAAASATILSVFGKLVDQVLTSQPIFIRGSVPPPQPQRPQS